MTFKILSTFALTVTIMATSVTAFAPSARNAATARKTERNAIEEMASAMQHSGDLLYHHGVVGPFSEILQGHHPAQFDDDGGIMMTEHLEDPILMKPGKGFVPPSPMKAAAVAVPSAAMVQEKSRGRPVPVCYMD